MSIIKKIEEENFWRDIFSFIFMGFHFLPNIIDCHMTLATDPLPPLWHPCDTCHWPPPSLTGVIWFMDVPLPVGSISTISEKKLSTAKVPGVLWLKVPSLHKAYITSLVSKFWMKPQNWKRIKNYIIDLILWNINEVISRMQLHKPMQFVILPVQ